MEQGKWKTVKSRIFHRNPWYVYREDDVIRPDGKPGKYYYVDEKDSSAVIAEDKDGKIFLVRQSRYPTKNIMCWDTIGGQIEKKDTKLGAAKRELLEEANLEAKKWKMFGRFFEGAGWARVEVFCYLATNLSFKKGTSDNTEDISAKAFTWLEIEKMIRKGEIINSYSLSVLYKYFLHKKQN